VPLDRYGSGCAWPFVGPASAEQFSVSLPSFSSFLFLDISKGTNADFNDLRIIDVVIFKPKLLYFVIRMWRLSYLRRFELLFPFFGVDIFVTACIKHITELLRET
jgi:hypothetical protein